MKLKKTKKRGVSLLETVVVVALLGVIVAIVGPVSRYYIRLGERYRFDVVFNKIAGDAFFKLEDVVSSAIMKDGESDAFGKKTVGFGFANPSANPTTLDTIKGYTLSTVPKESNANSKQNSTVFIRTPVYVKDPLDNKEKLGEAYHYFRFAEKGGELGLFYGSTLNSDGTGKYISSTAKLFDGTESKLLPGDADNIVLTGGVGVIDGSYFEETAAGVMITIKYKNASDATSTPTVVKRLFIKRGEI